MKNSQARLRKNVSDTTILSLLPQLREPVDYVVSVVLLGGNGVAEEAERLKRGNGGEGVQGVFFLGACSRRHASPGCPLGGALRDQPSGAFET